MEAALRENFGFARSPGIRMHVGYEMHTREGS